MRSNKFIDRGAIFLANPTLKPSEDLRTAAIVLYQQLAMLYLFSKNAYIVTIGIAEGNYPC
ncbi:hypothetical protein [Chamaesiphon sp. OTE_8_metabat_110]|uniref:hypothetical protein n=1 Tax=Chamaesiphon sp. OTE_8_metabat_110 TaxID=2964696 RepID=UPI00286B70A4|nr:hypothetical protein [Chamaesiphon sp. OTE_8_metabat_110]